MFDLALAIWIKENRESLVALVLLMAAVAPIAIFVAERSVTGNPLPHDRP